MFPGRFVLCLKTVNLADMRRFYEALGMVVNISGPRFVGLGNGDVDLALMTFLAEHSLNFRGADPFEIHENAVASGIAFEGEPMRYEKEQFDADADGMSWLTHDPDGNNVFFDTNEGELGEVGRVRDRMWALYAARRQLVNVGASDACREAFETAIVDRFLTSEQRAMIAHSTSQLTEPGRFPGHFTYCLKAADTARSRDWYAALGLEVGTPSEGGHIHMSSACCELDLMNFLGANWLNFRGADVFGVHRQLAEAGFDLEGEPVRYTEEEFGAPGMHWKTRDPDGNVVYFDTTDPELIEPGDPKVVRRVLERACSQLESMNADPECAAAIRSNVIDRYVPADA